MSEFILSQVLAGIAWLCDIASFQFKKKEHILLVLSISAALFSVHFYLLGHLTAAAIIFVSAVRMAIARKTSSNRMMYLFFFINVLIIIFTFQEPVNLLAFTATMLLTYANFRKDDRSLRLIMMLGTSSWIIHNTIIWSPAAMFVEMFFLVSNLLGYYRHYLRAP